MTGCFISVDPILNLEVPAHLHAYAYGFNNPVTFSDASGLEPRDKNGNFDGDPYSSPSTTSWAYLNGCGGNLSCVGTWMGQNTLQYYGGLAEGLVGLAFFACSSICMVGASVHSAVGAFSDWDAHLANEQAKGEQFREWWSDPWNNFWRPIGEDWANNPGHAWGGTVFTAATIAVPGGGLIKVGSLTGRVAVGTARVADNAAMATASIADDVSATTLRASNLTLSRTVANHALEGGGGIKSRPYGDSQLVMQEIMDAVDPIPDPGGLANGLRWDAPGSFGSRDGVWELVVDVDTETVVHFLFRGM